MLLKGGTLPLVSSKHLLLSSFLLRTVLVMGLQNHGDKWSGQSFYFT